MSHCVSGSDRGAVLYSPAMIFLETPRLLFRQHEARDEDDFVRMHMDPEVRRYVGGAAWSLEKAQDRFCKEYLGWPKET